MRRPKKALPMSLYGLAFNPESGLYEIEEDGITYGIRLEEVRLLRDYFQYFPSGGGVLYPKVSRWYKDLDRPTKKLVVRKGDIPQEDDGFYPDSSYDE